MCLDFGDTGADFEVVKSMNDDRIADAVRKSWREWAVDPLRHGQFCKNALAQAYEYANQEPQTAAYRQRLRELQESVFLQGNAQEAVLMALKGDILDLKEIIDKRDGIWVYDDALDLDYSPYYWSDKHQRRQISRHFRGISESRFCPFKRFSFTKDKDLRAQIACNWSDEQSVTGIVMEALVAWHLESRRIACLSCKLSGCLRWNGGGSLSSAWADMVCLSCEAAYEIKSKQTADKALTSVIVHNSLGGGSFSTYHANRIPGKHYLVVVNRLPRSLLGDDMPYHTVSVWEIDHVLPVLYPMSFNTNHHKILMRSKIVAKTETRQTWFTFDPLEMPVRVLVSQAFDDYFGAGSSVEQIDFDDYHNDKQVHQNLTVLPKHKPDRTNMPLSTSTPRNRRSTPRNSIVIGGDSNMPWHNRRASVPCDEILAATDEYDVF